MKFVDDVEKEKEEDGVEVQTVAPGDGFQIDRSYWMQASDTNDPDQRVTRVEHTDGLCCGINLQTGQLCWFPDETIVIPILLKFGIGGRADRIKR